MPGRHKSNLSLESKKLTPLYSDIVKISLGKQNHCLNKSKIKSKVSTQNYKNKNDQIKMTSSKHDNDKTKKEKFRTRDIENSTPIKETRRLSLHEDIIRVESSSSEASLDYKYERRSRNTSSSIPNEQDSNYKIIQNQPERAATKRREKENYHRRTYQNNPKTKTFSNVPNDLGPVPKRNEKESNHQRTNQSAIKSKQKFVNVSNELGLVQKRNEKESNNQRTYQSATKSKTKFSNVSNELGPVQRKTKSKTKFSNVSNELGPVQKRKEKISYKTKDQDKNKNVNVSNELGSVRKRKEKISYKTKNKNKNSKDLEELDDQRIYKKESEPENSTNVLNELGELNEVESVNQNLLSSNTNPPITPRNDINYSTSISNSFESEASSSDTNNKNEFTDSSTNESDDIFRYFSEEFFTVLYSNIDQSLTNKMNELLGIIEQHKPSIIMLTEIEPKARKDQTKVIKDSEISIPNYSLFTNQERKRGVAIYIENKSNPRDITSIINTEKFEECVFCEFEGTNSEKVLVGCMYKSPNSTKDNVEKMLTTIKNDKMNSYDTIVITGDFNYPKIKWEGGLNTGENEVFVETLKDAYLIQKVKNPTRNIRQDQRANIVDLVLTNDENMISDIVHIAPIGASDHDVLLFQMNMSKVRKKETKVKSFNLAKGNYKRMREDLKKVKWDKIDELEVEGQWEFIKKEIIDSMNKHIPKSNKSEIKKNKPCWMNDKVFRKIKKKYYAYKRYLVSKEGQDYEHYIKKRNECTREIKKAKKKHERNIAKGCRENPSKFWKYVNDKCKTNVGISSLKDDKGNLITTDQGKAELLNKFFTSVFCKENKTDLPNIEEGELSSGKLIGEIEISVEAVEKKLKELNPQKAQGPDKIPPKVLKEISKEIAYPLTKLFKKSIFKGQIPEDWKFAEVTAIFKKGNKTDPGNYRPVSLTCICCKILEQFVRDGIVNHMTENGLYSECQHGFRKSRSCVTQLIEVYDKLTELIDDGKSIDIVYLDFRKAFDSIPHERLLVKMKGYGINGNVIGWVRSFLADRKQRVRVGNSYSNKSDVTSGIPQGSILGPVLFTIFINDLPDALKVNCKVFADDTKIYDDTTENKRIQEDLYSMQKWTELWNLYFNVAKCKVMHIGKKNPQHEYFMKIEKEKQRIGTCNEEKDLGITFDKELNFDSHISNITKKANQMLGIIKRTFTFMNKDVFLKLYKALVRSHLEYGNVIWHPHLKRQSLLIESVQRRATKLVPECKDMNYDERLKYLKLYSLKGRRLRGDLIQVYKIFQGFDNIDHEKLLPITNYRSTRGQGFKLMKRHCKTDIRKYSFSNRVIENWNLLPIETKNASSINAFKNRIDKIPQLVEKFLDYDDR